MSKEEFLRILVELQAFRVCPPIEASRFVKELEACGSRTEIELLERFEQLGWERPLAHLLYPKRKSKLIPVEGKPNFSHKEPLHANEEWHGGTIEEYVRPLWRWNDMSSRLSGGSMRPTIEVTSFVWADYRDEKRRESGSPYYSQFQIYDIAQAISSTSLLENAAWTPANRTDSNFEAWVESRMRWSRITRKTSGTELEFKLRASDVCQAIASRYYFNTQTDGRVIQTTDDESHWNWARYCQEWKPKAVAARLGITPDEIRLFQEDLIVTASFKDPLAEWYDLLQFVSIERKGKLKAAAKYAQLLYSMEHMLRLFYRDLTDVELEPAQPHPTWTIDGRVEKQRHGDVRYLRHVANRYRVNPQPRLMLYVEGLGEAQAIPRLAKERFGTSLEHFGIVIRNLGSVSEFAGNKAERKYGALRRSIEELHDLQIITFILLDNEDKKIQAVKERLCTTPSSYRPGRTITRRELVFVWNASLEFDNFSNDEIAKAMTDVSKGLYAFSENEVSSARSRFGEKGDPLSRLYKEKLDYGLNKPETFGPF